MENNLANVKMVPDFRDAPRPSLFQRLGGNLLIPIGIMMTVGCYAVGLGSMITNRPMLGQKMMYARVAFQGMTVAAMYYDQQGASLHYPANQ
ncbi:PREDICTED: respiratory supercomplex factor 1, mitochondrial-like [Diuraphis noxia]|uniref:respiratory supercomplex factor 1, mitochondrial-like n=1 Tax=Diuraphis noxia TaxID=143948 RepID=UPI000763643B|nr:PREDICTED: respiratory supercomplex factor 1, mitochondrial-like [Diuraphis noxia]